MREAAEEEKSAKCVQSPRCLGTSRRGFVVLIQESGTGLQHISCSASASVFPCSFVSLSALTWGRKNNRNINLRQDANKVTKMNKFE